MLNQGYNIEELIARNDLVAFAERAGAKFKKIGGVMRSHCPLHGGENGTAFAVYEESGKQKWICFTDTCGGGDVIDFIAKWQNKTTKDAILFLGGEVSSDPVEMERLARERHERAVADRQRAEQIERERRAELQREEKHLFYHNNMSQFFIEQWISRGLGEEWQGFWNLGGCSDFIVNDNWHTPTLTIPIVDEHYEVLNIKHRLLNPPKPGDKYRPEKPGLGKFPYFLTYPDLGYGRELVFVLEGEVKSMVTASITPDADWQYIGVPGLSQYGGLVDKLFGKNVVVVADPGAEAEAGEFTKKVSGRMVELSEKIDDLIVAHGYDADWLRSIERQARRVK